MLTTQDVARRLGVGPDRVKQLVRAGRLHPTKFGRAWAYDQAEVEAFAQLERRPGRPAGDVSTSPPTAR